LKRLRIAIIGIEGSGKSWLIGKALETLGDRGSTITFSRIPGIQAGGRIILRTWRWAHAKHYKLPIILLAALVTVLYGLAQWRMRKVEVLFLEHYPLIDLPAFGALYANRAGSFLGHMVAWIFPKPNIILFLDIPIDVAEKRIRERGKPIQLYESCVSLAKLHDLLRERALSFPNSFLCNALSPDLPKLLQDIMACSLKETVP